VELFAHVHAALLGPVLHLNVVKETTSNNSQCIFWPALKITKKIIPLKFMQYLLVSCTVDTHHLLYYTWNQSMVQQLTNDGNFLSLVLKASPIGLMARTTCSCSRTRSMNMLKRARGVPSVCLDFSRPLKQHTQFTIKDVDRLRCELTYQSVSF
jgi:hypothetical protein